MAHERLILVAKLPKGERATFQSAESDRQRARWLLLADIALGNPIHEDAELKQPGARSVEEHKRVLRKLKKAVEAAPQPRLKRAA